MMTPKEFLINRCKSDFEKMIIEDNFDDETSTLPYFNVRDLILIMDDYAKYVISEIEGDNALYRKAELEAMEYNGYHKKHLPDG